MIRQSLKECFGLKCLIALYRRHYVPGEARTAVPIVPKKALEANEEAFVSRHVGPDAIETNQMLAKLGFANQKEFLSAILPECKAASSKDIKLPAPLNEKELTELMREYGQLNKPFKSFIGQGYYGSIMPSVIRRNVLENPAWYTPYTPYQPEISQGRLESLLNFQTMVCELTGLPIANASLLDEATAACEAMTMAYYAAGGRKKTFLVDPNCFPATIACLKTRAEGIGFSIVEGDDRSKDAFGYLLQYPDKEGRINLDKDRLQRLRSMKIPIISATDLLALTLIKSPGELDFDIAVGSTQRFGLPFGYGGPHAAFLSCKEEYKRLIPGRIVGVSKDVFGERALRLALQTREQHIRRERAISNICTAQVLPANLAAFYAIYHGPDGLQRIASRIHEFAVHLADAAMRLGHRVRHEQFFDTIVIELGGSNTTATTEYYHELGGRFGLNLGRIDEHSFSITFDETHDEKDVKTILRLLAGETEDLDPDAIQVSNALGEMEPEAVFEISDDLKREEGSFMQQTVFKEHQTETKMMRYIHWLQSKDLSLIHSMIPLGSCTMKLNAAVELQALGSSAWMEIHPMAPKEQTKGYEKMLRELKGYLAEITGLRNVSLQPNSGAQGEYTGLRVIKAFHIDNGNVQRTKCIVPVSAHGTNPASAIMAGLEVVKVPCSSSDGSLDLEALTKIIESDAKSIAAIMVTYPSTFGTFDENIPKACEMVRQVGGKVYLDGANMNAMVGYLRPVDVGADVCHLNLHKTFCVPHGGGGPGAGPIAVSDQLAPYLPNDPSSPASKLSLGPISGTPYGSASILTISWAYICLMGLPGLQEATFKALLNANYMMACLAPYYPTISLGGGKPVCAHEFVLDLRPFVESAGITALDVAKRLQDYGFHSPTMSWPVNNTMLIEPTESESKEELDWFIQAMISIRKEMASIEKGEADRSINVLKMAPHVIEKVTADSWDRPYSREQATFPLPHLKKKKFWPLVSRLDDVYGDQNLVCVAPKNK